jgi:hypothetical protein
LEVKHSITYTDGEARPTKSEDERERERERERESRGSFFSFTLSALCEL